jgi:hypothetical protein
MMISTLSASVDAECSTFFEEWRCVQDTRHWTTSTVLFSFLVSIKAKLFILVKGREACEERRKGGRRVVYISASRPATLT